MELFFVGGAVMEDGETSQKQNDIFENKFSFQIKDRKIGLEKDARRD